MFTTILVALVAIVVLFVVIVALQPAGFNVVRSTTIDAPPREVFPHVNDLHGWDAWSPWAKKDPAMKQWFDGPPAGTGAKYGWSGNREVGEGSMTITDSRDADLVGLRLDFVKPFKGTNSVEITFRPDGDDRTLVTWTMTGCKHVCARAFGLFIDIDRMVGDDFAKGLAQLKVISERGRDGSSAAAPVPSVALAR